MSTPPTLPYRRKPLWVRLLIILGVAIGLVGATVVALRITGMIAVYKIPTGAMAPVLCPGDHILAERLSLSSRPLQRGDIAVFDTSQVPGIVEIQGPTNGPWIKRVAALPGDRVQLRDEQIWINGTPAAELAAQHYFTVKPGSSFHHAIDLTAEITVPVGHYLMLGDNSANSLDSRYCGFIPATSILQRYSCHYITAADRSGNVPGRR